MELCLVTSNIRFDNPADGPNLWAHRKGFLAEVLLAHCPDVIATQEGRYHQLKELEALLPGYVLMDEHRSWIKERMYPSFFLKRDKFEIFPGEDLWLSQTPEVAGSRSFESAFPRLVTWVKVQPKGTEQNILLFNTHLDHVKVETRIGQIQVLAQEGKRVQTLHPCPLVFMGDFNDAPESEVRKILEHNFKLTDAWKMVHAHEESSHHAFRGEMEAGTRIDWILVDRSLEVQKCFMDKSQRNGAYPSDHFPVVCTITI